MTKRLRIVAAQILSLTLIILCFGLVASILYEAYFRGKIYPRVSVGGTAASGKTPGEVTEFWLKQNTPFEQATFELRFEDHVATVSGLSLELGFDATLSATQAYLVGRSGYVFSDLYHKFVSPTNLAPLFRWNTEVLDAPLEELAGDIHIPVQNALFRFDQGRVTSFRPSQSGRIVNMEKTKKHFETLLSTVAAAESNHFILELAVDTVSAEVTTDQVNDFGIKELIGRGYSQFTGSASGRVHNIVLAASRINGILIKPGETFSFNKTLGDISAATGYQSAYIIKDGRTILGDGGGVCQVSTTLFRAALDAGLPIPERWAHSYRVRYYELGGFKAGLDATVYDPTFDLKIKNDTPAYILIQAKPNTKNQTLTFEMYGTSDGRQSEVLSHVVGAITPPPPDLYQDDPTLPAGSVKQVDWAASGAKTSFQYKVTKDGDVLTQKTFSSNFQPWQAVYLRGPQ